MGEVSIIGVDLAKNVFQLQGRRWTGGACSAKSDAYAVCAVHGAAAANAWWQ